MLTLRKTRFAFIVLGLIAAAGVIAPLFLIAGCRTLQQTPQEVKAGETLRSMTRGGVLPAEDAVARIEADYPKTTAGALAKIVHARVKLNAKDFAGAASLLDASTIRDYTVIGDYGLWLRAGALEQSKRRPEARAAYEQLARNYPSSIRAREALLHDAQLMIQDGQAAEVRSALEPLTAKFDPAALLLSAKAYEQTGNLPHALLAYRSIYILAPASPEAVEATEAITRLGSTTATSSGDNTTRAEKLFAAKHYAEAYDAYTSAFSNSPDSVNEALLAHRVIAAANAHKFPEAVAALPRVPSGELRAEGMFNLAMAYGRAKQWAQARSTTEDLRHGFPGSVWTTRAFVQLGQHAEDAKDGTNASYFYRAAVSFDPGNADCTHAQLYLALQ